VINNVKDDYVVRGNDDDNNTTTSDNIIVVTNKQYQILFQKQIHDLY